MRTVGGSKIGRPRTEPGYTDDLQLDFLTVLPMAQVVGYGNQCYRSHDGWMENPLCFLVDYSFQSKFSTGWYF